MILACIAVFVTHTWHIFLAKHVTSTGAISTARVTPLMFLVPVALVIAVATLTIEVRLISVVLSVTQA